MTLCKKKVLFEWNFSGKKLWPKNIFHLVDRAEKIAFPPLNYDQKVEFWPFLAFLACYVQHCSHSRPSALVQLASLESSDPFMRAVRHGSPYGVLEVQYKNTCCNYGKIRSYAAANTFHPSKNICSSLLNTPNLFNWLEGHFRPTHIPRKNNENWANFDIFESILLYLDGPVMVNVALVSRVLIENMHLVDSPPYHCTIYLFYLFNIYKPLAALRAMGLAERWLNTGKEVGGF